MIQGIKALGNQIGIDSGAQNPQKADKKKEGPDIGALLSGKKPIMNSITNHLNNIQELGDKNKEKLDISI